MRSSITAAVLLSFGIAAVSQLANAQPPLPRKSPELSIVEPSGKTTLLSSYRGKVVVLALINTGCPHCQHECEVLTQLYKEMAPQGVQMLAVAFDQGAQAAVPGFIRDHGVTFPVGYAGLDTAVNFLGFSIMDRFVVPQMVVIDRKGMIRNQSGPQGDPKLQDVANLKELITTYLKEGPTTTSRAHRSSGQH